jgi:hypothetical protein
MSGILRRHTAASQPGRSTTLDGCQHRRSARWTRSRAPRHVQSAHIEEITATQRDPRGRLSNSAATKSHRASSLGGEDCRIAHSVSAVLNGAVDRLSCERDVSTSGAVLQHDSVLNSAKIPACAKQARVSEMCSSSRPSLGHRLVACAHVGCHHRKSAFQRIRAHMRSASLTLRFSTRDSMKL